MIYFIQAEPDGRIKIGKADYPERRLRDLQTGSPVPLKLIGVIDGDIDEEKKIHAMFQMHWSHGEWFEPAQEIIEFSKGSMVSRPHICSCRQCGRIFEMPPSLNDSSHTKDPKRVAAGRKSAATHAEHKMKMREKPFRQHRVALDRAPEE